MKKLVTPNFRNKLANIFPQMFEYNCCAKGTHEKFLQYALFSPYKSVTTGAVLFDLSGRRRVGGGAVHRRRHARPAGQLHAYL